MIELMNYKGVCRSVPATPGLLKSWCTNIRSHCGGRATAPTLPQCQLGDCHILLVASCKFRQQNEFYLDVLFVVASAGPRTLWPPVAPRQQAALAGLLGPGDSVDREDLTVLYLQYSGPLHLSLATIAAVPSPTVTTPRPSRPCAMEKPETTVPASSAVPPATMAEERLPRQLLGQVPRVVLVMGHWNTRLTWLSTDRRMHLVKVRLRGSSTANGKKGLLLVYRLYPCVVSCIHEMS